MKNVEGNLELISEIFSGVGKWHDLWVDTKKEKVTTINFDEPIHISDPTLDTEEVRSLLILYVTETGNAQDAADYIARECRRIRFQCRVASLDSYSLVCAHSGCSWEPRH